MTSLPAQAPAATILIVDDQEQNLHVVGTVLKMMGHEIIPATSGEQAFKRLVARTPDLILLDVLMPEMDGLEVCRQLKADERWATIPVIFLSAADDKNLIVQALECGGVDYVTKPFNKAELVTRVRTHLALKQARDQLRDLAEDRDELLGILTHDLANHLTDTGTRTMVLQEHVGEMPSKCVPVIETIAQSNSRMLTSIREFLANQSAARLQLQPALVSLGALLNEAKVRHAAAAQAKQIRFLVELPDLDIEVMADKVAIAQVIDNLVTNAIKFSAAGLTVKLSAGSGPLEWAHFTIRDEGPGFTEEDRKTMFRRYGRLSARPTAGEPSAGLGLSIVKHLVEAVNGLIQLDSEPGKGASFTVRLPAKARE